VTNDEEFFAPFQNLWVNKLEASRAVEQQPAPSEAAALDTKVQSHKINFGLVESSKNRETFKERRGPVGRVERQKGAWGREKRESRDKR
jgi:hypothetical protein